MSLIKNTLDKIDLSVLTAGTTVQSRVTYGMGEIVSVDHDEATLNIKWQDSGETITAPHAKLQKVMLVQRGPMH